MARSAKTLTRNSIARKTMEDAILKFVSNNHNATSTEISVGIGYCVINVRKKLFELIKLELLIRNSFVRKSPKGQTHTEYKYNVFR